MTLDDLDTSLDHAPVKEPSKRWTVYFVARRSYINSYCNTCGKDNLGAVKIGDVTKFHCQTFPSKELAEEEGLIYELKFDLKIKEVVPVD